MYDLVLGYDSICVINAFIVSFGRVRVEYSEIQDRHFRPLTSVLSLEARVNAVVTPIFFLPFPYIPLIIRLYFPQPFSSLH